METNSIKSALTRSLGGLNLKLQKHSPEILLGVGIVGMVAAAVMAAKATLKVEEIVEEHNEAMTLVDLPEEKETATVYIQTGFKFAKLYGPSVSLGALSIAAILSSHGVMANRQASLVAAYNVIMNGWTAYRERVVEEFGEQKDFMFANGLREEEYKTLEVDENGDMKKVKKTRLVKTGDPKMYDMLFAMGNPNWKEDALLNMAWLEAQQRWLNDKLIIRGYLFLNEVREDLGLKPVPEGQLVGWVLRTPEEMKTEHRDGYISLGLDNFYNKSGQAYEEGAILINPNVDGVIYNLI